MKPLTKLLLAALAVAVLIAGCTGAAHIRALQPPAVPKSPPVRVPVVRPAVQLGIDIDAYTYRGQDIAAAAAQDVAYVTSLHANAVIISFPFFMSGPGSSTVYATSATPSPDQLAMIVEDAEKAGLYVGVRPLLDESSIKPYAARTLWQPADLPAWFTSYSRFLVPYASAAQDEHAQEFFAGAEFSRFGSAPGWARVDAAVSSVFHGTIAYANNWDRPDSRSGGPGVTDTLDAYRGMQPPLLANWEIYDRTLPRGTVLTEVGIAAAAGAWAAPWRHAWQTAVLDPGVQAQWFSAACRAALAAHLGGIYFWSIGLGTPSGPSLTDQGAWARSAGASAISSCFAQEVSS
jgi:hypothetical protein